MTLAQIFSWGGGGLFLLLTLVELAPIKVNPWSWLAKSVGKAIGIAAVEKKLDEHISTDDRRDADRHRMEILRFNNELLRSIDHTKEEFIEVLAEIDAYERFCEDHPDYDGKYCPHRTLDLGWERFKKMVEKYLKEDDDMTAAEVKEIIRKENPTYNTLDEVPSYWRADIKELVDKGIIAGSGGGKLGLTKSDCKAAVLTVEEWRQIAEALGAKARVGFLFPDGKEI